MFTKDELDVAGIAEERTETRDAMQRDLTISHVVKDPDLILLRGDRNFTSEGCILLRIGEVLDQLIIGSGRVGTEPQEAPPIDTLRSFILDESIDGLQLGLEPTSLLDEQLHDCRRKPLLNE